MWNTSSWQVAVAVLVLLPLRPPQRAVVVLAVFFPRRHRWWRQRTR
jgi:hypothetical protein